MTSDEDDDLDIPAWVGAEPPRRPRPSPSSASASGKGRTVSRPAGDGPSPASASRNGDEPGTTLTEDDPYAEFLGPDQRGRGFVRLPRRHRGMRRLAAGSLGLFVLVVAALAGTGLWFMRQLDPSGQPGDAIVIAIPAGSTTPDVARLLADGGVVANRTLFEQYLKLKGPARYLAGRYSFLHRSSMAEAVAAIEKGPIPAAFVQVTLPEGLRVDEIRARLADAVPWFAPADLDAALLANSIRSRYQPNDVATLEGLVFPETYRIEEGASPAATVNQMLAQFDKVAADVKLDTRAPKLGVSPYQAVVIASMIEREARVPEDRPKIARVIYNRLAEKMRLDIDATVVYAVGGRTPLTQADLETDSPYNTRLYKGLPPTPIAAPGAAALEAALAPADGPWLYYVLADHEGRHYFTDSASDFERAVEEADAAGLLG